MENKFCPFKLGRECTATCGWFDETNNGCIVKSIVIELVKLNERLEDASPRRGES